MKYTFSIWVDEPRVHKDHALLWLVKTLEPNRFEKIFQSKEEFNMFKTEIDNAGLSLREVELG